MKKNISVEIHFDKLCLYLVGDSSTIVGRFLCVDKL